MKFRVGNGFDVHRLQERRDLYLGGIKIPHAKGLLGHSDADVLIHAICDALLGAVSLGDIGTHFPDSSPEYKNIDSKLLLSKVVALVKEKGYEICNVDSIVCMEEPKISPYISVMKKTLAQILQIGEDDISVKATTTERLGYVGRQEGVAAYAVALICK